MRRRRAFVLIAVLVLVGSALFVTTGLIVLAQAEAAALAGSGDQAQSRAIAWSGLQVLMHELDGQRATILEGDLAELEASYTIYERDTVNGVIRLLPSGPGGAICQPEAARLDVNVVTADDLKATTFVDPALAAAIIGARDALPGGRFHSIVELLEVDGVTPAVLWGEPEDMLADLDSTLDVGSIEERNELRFGARLRGLADLLTVHAVEPALQRSGVKRINLDVPWSDELARRLDDRFGEGAATLVKSIIDDGASFASEAGLYKVYVDFGVDPSEWRDSCDAITAEEGDHHFGRVDINSAPLEALQGLPGVTQEQAALIVDTREDLDADTLATIAWPASEEILPADAYLDLAGRITTRSWTYRVRIAAGEVPADDPEAPIVNPVIYEAVIDLADPAPRLAYLRDLSLQSTAIGLAIASTETGLAERREFDRDRLRETDWPDDAESQPDELAGDSLEMPGLDFGGDLDFGGGLDFGGDSGVDADLDSGSTSGDDEGPAADTGPPAQPTQFDQPAQTVGRRIGRWTTGS